jgi:SepF-like predicted cell division protein (DUF552 family)
MKFALFRKPKKQPEPEKSAESKEGPKADTAIAPEESKQETTTTQQEPTPAAEPQPKPEPAIVTTQETAMPPVEQKLEAAEPISKTYLKAMPLKELTDIENVKNEVRNGNIIILRVTPLATKNIEEVKNAVNQLYEFAESSGGDIARLGEERVVICPKNIRIWREKTLAQNDSLPTTAPTAA